MMFCGIRNSVCGKDSSIDSIFFGTWRQTDTTGYNFQPFQLQIFFTSPYDNITTWNQLNFTKDGIVLLSRNTNGDLVRVHGIYWDY